MDQARERELKIKNHIEVIRKFWGESPTHETEAFNHIQYLLEEIQRLRFVGDLLVGAQDSILRGKLDIAIEALSKIQTCSCTIHRMPIDISTEALSQIREG